MVEAGFPTQAVQFQIRVMPEILLLRRLTYSSSKKSLGAVSSDGSGSVFWDGGDVNNSAWTVYSLDLLADSDSTILGFSVVVLPVLTMSTLFPPRYLSSPPVWARWVCLAGAGSVRALPVPQPADHTLIEFRRGSRKMVSLFAPRKKL